MKLFNRIIPQDITLVQTDWKCPDDYSHMWTATYYGEPVGKVFYGEQLLIITGQTYAKKEIQLYKKYYKNNWYNVNKLSFKEIRKLRMCKRKFARFLNKLNYEHD